MSGNANIPDARYPLTSVWHQFTDQSGGTIPQSLFFGGGGGGGFGLTAGSGFGDTPLVRKFMRLDGGGVGSLAMTDSLGSPIDTLDELHHFDVISRYQDGGNLGLGDSVVFIIRGQPLAL